MKRRWLLYILIILFIWIFVGQLSALENLAMTVINSRWPWVLVAALIQVLYYGLYAGIYRSAYQTVEVKSRIRELIPVIFASMFVNVAAPSGGTSGLAVFVDDATRRGASPVRAAVGTLLGHAVHFAAFVFILIPGLWILTQRHDLRSYEVFTASLLILLVGLIIAVLILGLRQPDQLNILLKLLQKLEIGLTQRLKLKSRLPANWAQDTAAEFTEASLAAATHPGWLIASVAFGITANVIDMVSLYALFLAFHQPISISILVAGFAMGILFWEITITPQGIGVVEGVMILTFVSLGIPAERATVIAITFRFLTFWLPFFAGFFILPQLKTFKSDRFSQGEFNVHLVAILTAGMGVINVISAITPTMPVRFQLLSQISPLAVRQGSHLAGVLAGFALFLLAQGIWRRKRAAWVLTLAVLGLSIIVHILNHSQPEVIVVASALFAWLVYLRREFHALSDIPSMRQGFIALLAATLFTLVYGTIGFFILDRHFNVKFGLVAAIRQTIVMFTQFYDPGLQPITGFGRFFANSIYFVGAVTLGYALIMLIRPVLIRSPSSSQDIEKARKIIAEYGPYRQVKNYLLKEKNYFFDGQDSLIVYQVKGHIAIVLGDPFCPEGSATKIINKFIIYCQKNDWEPAWINVAQSKLLNYKDFNLLTLQIGQDAVVQTSSFSLEDPKNIDMSLNYANLERLGYKLNWLSTPVIDKNLIHKLKQIDDEWLTQIGRSETHFATDWFDPDQFGPLSIPTILDGTGGIVVFCRIIEYQLGEMDGKKRISLDLLRYRNDVNQDILNFLYISLIHWAKQNSYETINLGFSTLARVYENRDDPALERGLYFLLKIIRDSYSFHDYYSHLEKYNPTWSPRFLVYPSIPSLPLIALALLRADSSDNWTFLWQSLT